MSEYSTSSWEKPSPKYITFTLWDIDREFQRANEAYDQWLCKNRKSARYSRLSCLSLTKLQDDELGRALSLGQQVQEQIEYSLAQYGRKFESGDSICHSILEAQLLRIQHEVYIPLIDCGLARKQTELPQKQLITAAKAVRRTTLQTLRDLHGRLEAPLAPALPLPRFSVRFCPFALQLQKVRKDQDTSFSTRKVRPHDKYDEREECPYCNCHIAVSQHSGLPNYRRILFQSHTAPALSEDKCSAQSSKTASFACPSCYKTFHDSYGLLDHVFQKEINSERSCQKRWSNVTTDWRTSNPFGQVYLELDPVLVEKCLRNCLRRELTRVKDTESLQARRKGGVLPDKC